MSQVREFRRFVTLVSLLSATVALSQATKISAPRNRYSASDDVKLGQEAAAQVRREMPLLPENGPVDSYVGRIGQALAAAIPPEFAHQEFRYEFSVVNASDINAFALPGGPMFVNRGMIEAANSEGEMAGVMAHELSHVALRHGTAQATKSQNAGIQLGALGGAILGAIIGGDTGEVVAQGTQIGLGVYLLKYSREYETQADILGAQILARAGYDPMDLARMFETIERQGGRGGPEWMSSHPNPGNRQDRIAEESRKLNTSSSRERQSAEFNGIRDQLKRMAPAPTMSEIARAGREDESGRSRYPDDAEVERSIQLPSSRYRTFEANGRFRISVPDNWRQLGEGASITFAPDGAYGNVRGQSVFTHGAIVGIENISSSDLTRATDQFVAGLLEDNAYLTADAKYKRTRMGGRDALRRRLAGKSPVTSRKEIVDVYTAAAGGNRLFFIVQVVPGNEQGKYRRAFDEMVRSAVFIN